MRRRWVIAVLVVCISALPILAAGHSSAVFKRLQSLAGDWEGKDADGMAVKTTFKVLISDTAIMETISPHGMEEMMTVYSVDRDGIALVHYCPTNNQPHMRVVPDHLVLRLEDADHITETWTWRQNGKDTPMVFHLARKK